MTGLQRSTVSPSSSSMSRSTPWVRRVLRPHVDDHRSRRRRLVVARRSARAAAASASLMRSTAPDLAQQLRRASSSLRGCSSWAPSRRSDATALGRVDGVTAVVARVIGRPARPLNCTGMRPDVVVLAQRVADPVLGHEDAGQVGVAVEADAEHVVHLALHRLGARATGRTATGTTGRRSGTCTRTRTRRALARCRAG